MIRIKRAYEPADPSDGKRVLVDRLWPRGVPRKKAAIDEWARELAPSEALRKWFGHEPEKFRAFKSRYKRELGHEPARSKLEKLAKEARRSRVTLVFGAADVEHSNAAVLAEMLGG